MWSNFYGWCLIGSMLGLCLGQHAPCYTCELLKNKTPGHKLVLVEQKAPLIQRDTEKPGDVCGGRCWCSTGAPFSCLPGVTAVRDGCDCCMTCPRQLGDHCDERNVCDRQRNLECLHGQCTVENTSHADCFAGGEWYKSGVKYSLGCQRLCTCYNGYFICTNQCKHEKSPPLSCPNARLVKIESQCCREWMCDTYVPNHTVESAVSTHDGLPEPSHSGSDYCENVVSTDWSMCSKSCGWGQSMRYRDKKCLPDIRNCQIRPCDIQPSHFKRHINVELSPQPARQRHTLREKTPQYITIDKCRSMRKFTRRYCNNTTSGNNCCHPTDVITKVIRMKCDNETIVRSNVMFIRECFCSSSCLES